MIKQRPAVVVLAAGRGQRFKGSGHKLEQVLGDGTLLQRSLGCVLSSQLPLVVVTCSDLAPVVQRFVAARDVVVLDETNHLGEPLGQGDSIAAGVAAAGDAPGWLILPADMPQLQARSLLDVAAALDQYPIAYAQHKGLPGHPVGFSAELYSELTALRGDDGARRLLARYPAQAVELDDPGVLVDVDTVEDLQRLRAQMKKDHGG
ncbi:nucleotidyltransferase family protein [Pelomonas sp. CA6]|uniref:nucleotidyltransferase family protein n=1 Tax=Pelomonas sp. CA6 TaxID=2907999 RepID=UPI001F4BDBAE|nr:nucleotidyltransferase family protein [Pelomonas sp. CA6]MCH7345588.1 nucleotidyltransferase family protein [Pelomonas sp. CA6]